ncbi:MAG: anti-sigma factor family protein [Armatimonadota bacterium]
MNCKECENLLAAYVSDDLNGETCSACSLHLRECESCRYALESYSCLINIIANSPTVPPTKTESINLCRSLKSVKLTSPIKSHFAPWQKLERITLMIMCIISFIAITLITKVIRSGQVSINIITDPIIILPSIAIIIFIVSFLPIVITARRKPLNGATFKR